MSESKTQTPDLEASIQQVLDLMTQEEADALIVEAGDEYKTLGTGMKAIYGLLWATMRRFGLRQNARSFRVMSQSMILMSVVVHYAYALGIRRGAKGSSNTEGTIRET